MSLPENYDHSTVESKWRESWEKWGTYKWDPNRPRQETFVIDTPPPTVSGSLHVGHVFSYTQTDVIARFQRMRGKNVFYPIGWDDNGLATERRVQNYFGIKCEPSLAYDPNWKAISGGHIKDKAESVSRRNFIESCAILTRQDEEQFERLFRKVGLSFDWALQYATIDRDRQRLSQFSFLDLQKRGFISHSDAPFMWDTTFKSAIAQAEIEDREIPGAYHDLCFGVEGGGEFTISTTRPELLPACIAVVAHPDDKRYQPLFGKFAISPLFYGRVPICAASHADPEKGTGILMVCTFGDQMDVQWWKSSGLPLKQVIGMDGRMLEIDFRSEIFASLDPESAETAYNNLKGLTVRQAQRKIVELLRLPGSGYDRTSSALKGEPKAITHAVKFYEKGDLPIEFIPTRQWFVSLMEHKEALIEQGKKVNWHPSHMGLRYENWVQGLSQDWCISRQRFFGVPFPVWYPLDGEGKIVFKSPIFAEEDRLPVDPMVDTPQGYSESQRNQPRGFAPDMDVMDTWATSSLTPQIESKWGIDQKRHDSLFPMDMRPQAHDIIRTWAFYTIAKAWMHEKKIPWQHAVISGFITDPDRKKMSKSKGNVVTPEALIDEHSADSVRYWASKARLGQDTAYDPSLFKIGRKLTTKLFNMSKFVLMQLERTGMDLNKFDPKSISEPLDLALLEGLKKVISEATLALENFDFALALQLSEDFFWPFCDHYLELVKVRAYKEEDSAPRTSALLTLAWALKTFLRLFAPIVPHVTEEIWSHSFGRLDKSSVHRANWPKIDEITAVANGQVVFFEVAVEVLSAIRGAKTEAQCGLKTPVKELKIKGSSEALEILKLVLPDLINAGSVDTEGVTFEIGTPAQGRFEVGVVLGGG